MSTKPHPNLESSSSGRNTALKPRSKPDDSPSNSYGRGIEAIAGDLEVDVERGLASSDALRRLEIHGPNQLAEKQQVSPLMMFLQQLVNPLLIILLVGAAISGYTGHWVDAIAIFIIVLINASISFLQEFKAEQSLAALNEMAAPMANVRRDGDWTEIPARDIVPGDVLRIKAGDILAADVRWIEANRLQVDEERGREG